MFSLTCIFLVGLFWWIYEKMPPTISNYDIDNFILNIIAGFPIVLILFCIIIRIFCYKKFKKCKVPETIKKVFGIFILIIVALGNFIVVSEVFGFILLLIYTFIGWCLFISDLTENNISVICLIPIYVWYQIKGMFWAVSLVIMIFLTILQITLIPLFIFGHLIGLANNELTVDDLMIVYFLDKD